jgi:hypothetical protein
MSIRPNPAGQEGKITWGVLGKRKTFVNQAFKEVPDLSTEERKQQLLDKMKPYNSQDYLGREIFVVGGNGQTPTPTPTPVETFYLTNLVGDPLITTTTGDNLIWLI